MNTSRQELKRRGFRLFKETLIITLYLWAVFGLLVLHKSMILAEHHIDPLLVDTEKAKEKGRRL